MQVVEDKRAVCCTLPTREKSSCCTVAWCMEETDPAGSQSRCARYMCSNNDFTAEAIPVMAGARHASLMSTKLHVQEQSVLHRGVIRSLCQTLNQVL